MADDGFFIPDAQLRELGLALQGLADDMQLKIARSMTNAGAQVIKKRAIVKAPEATGNLKKNIIVKRIPPNETRLTSEHIVTVRRKRTAKQTGAGIESAYYARFLEVGTVKMAARPFLRPAFDAGRSDAIEAMKTRATKRIEKANKS